MVSITDFIIHIDKPFHDTFTTENGVKLFGDKRMMAELMANKFGTVVSLPLGVETPIKEGFQVMFDPSIIYEQIYALTHGVQESIHLVDKKNKLYKIQPNLIVLYRENELDEWKGNMTNCIMEQVEIIQKEEAKQSSLIITKAVQKRKYHNNQARLVYGNPDLEAKPGDRLLVKDDYGLNFDIDGKVYKWFRNEDLVAILL